MKFGSIKNSFIFNNFSQNKKLLLLTLLIAVLVPVLLLTVSQVTRRQDQQSGASVSISSLTNCSVTSSELSLDSKEQNMLQQVNQYRQQNGLSPLAQQTDLNRAAAWFSKDLHANDARGHVDSLGRDPSARTRDCGYAYPNSVGENTGTSNSVASMLDWWKGSTGHNQQLLKSTYKTIGVGNTGNKWVLVFSNQDGSAPTATSVPSTPTNTPATRTPTRPPGSSPSPTRTITSSPPVSNTPATPTPAGPTPTPIPVGSTTILNISVVVPKVTLNSAMPVTVRMFDTQNNQVLSTNLHLYSAQNNTFKGQVNAGENLPTGYYTLKIKGNNTLQKNIEPYIQHLENKKSHDIPTITLIQGDLNNDNILSGEDIQAFISHMSRQVSFADFNYDGVVDIRDYSIFISSFSNVAGD